MTMEAIRQKKGQLKRMLVTYLKETIPLLETYTPLGHTTATYWGNIEGFTISESYSADPKTVEIVVERKVITRTEKSRYSPESFVENVNLDTASHVAEALSEKVKEAQKVKTTPTISGS